MTPVPLTIVGGFLGSGKTSLLNHVLSKVSGKRIVALVNDFGAINIDAKLVVSVEGQTVSLANGCVCCTIRDDLQTEVLRLFEKEPLPEHIILETSGVSDPRVVADTFQLAAMNGFVDVQSIIAVLDADVVVDKQSEYRPLAIEQIKIADLVVVNKTDLVTPEKLVTIKRDVESIVPRARIWETTYGAVPLELVFDDTRRGGLGPSVGRSPAVQHDKAFGTWTYRSDLSFSFGAMQRVVEHLPRDIYRAKGTVRLAVASDDYGVLQVTGRRGTLKLCEPQPDDEEVATELVFIGKPGANTDDTIREHVEGALRDASTQGDDGYTVTDLRAFNVIFA